MNLVMLHAGHRKVFIKQANSVVNGRWNLGGYGDEVHRQLSWQVNTLNALNDALNDAMQRKNDSFCLLCSAGLCS